MSQSSVMPGFRPTIGFTLIYLGLVVLIPLSTLVFKSFALTWDDYVHIITNKRVISSFRVSFGSAMMAASIASIFGFITAFEASMEEAGASLGATRLQVFTKIIFPNIFPALLTGFALAFARGVGEYGSVIFIAGNIPYLSEIVPLLIVTKLEQFDIEGATAIALTMLLISFLLLLLINLLQYWVRKRSGQL